MRTGEHRVARAKAQSEKRLLETTLLSAGTNETIPTPTGASAKARERGSPRIERATMSDPVGNQVQMTKTLKCTFVGRVEIIPKQFLDSGIVRVECQALRQVTPSRGVLRSPSHDKRKTRSAQTEQRWVQCETGWKFITGTNTDRRYV